MNDNMQDILKNYYANGGKELFESREELDEGLFTTAMVFAGLTALLGGDPVQKGLDSEVNQIVQDIQRDTLDSYRYDPYYIAKTLGVPVESILDPEFSKDSGRPRAGFNKDVAVQYVKAQNTDVSYSQNKLDSKKISPVYTYGNYNLNVMRSSEVVQEPNEYTDATVYLTSCLLEAVVSRDGEYYHADKFLNFYHVYSKEINDMDKCNPKLIIAQLEDAFRTNPLLIDPNRPQVESAENVMAVDASDIFSRYRLTPKQKDDWNNMEAQVLSNMGMYGISAPQTIGLVRKELAKLGINITIDAIMPNDTTPGSLAYSSPNLEPRWYSNS